jgi:hypothetical protein
LQIVMGNESPIGLDQDQKNVESARAELDRHAAGEQSPLAHQQTEAAELEGYPGCSRALPIREYR